MIASLFFTNPKIVSAVDSFVNGLVIYALSVMRQMIFELPWTVMNSLLSFYTFTVEIDNVLLWYFGFSLMDLALVTICIILIFTLIRIARGLIRTVTQSLNNYYRNYLLYRSAVPVPPIVKTCKVDYTFMNALQKESAFNSSNSYSTIVQEPKGIFRIFVSFDGETPSFIGHGFAVDNNMYSVHHNFSEMREGAKYYAAAPFGTQMLQITVDASSPEIDFVKLGPKRVLAALEIKSLKASFPTSNLLSIYTYDGISYRMQTIQAERYNKALNDDPSVIYTKSNTSNGDSGLPVMSSGKAVAIHIGANQVRKCNVHRVLTQLVKGETLSLSQKYLNVYNVEVESRSMDSSSTQNSDFSNAVERAKAIAKFEKDEAEYLMLGKHRNDEDAAFVSRAPSVYTFKGPSWADEMDFENDVDGAFLGLKVTAPPGALKVPGSPRTIFAKKDTASADSSQSSETPLTDPAQSQKQSTTTSTQPTQPPLTGSKPKPKSKLSKLSKKDLDQLSANFTLLLEGEELSAEGYDTTQRELQRLGALLTSRRKKQQPTLQQ